jgi:hypothetical protein
MREQGWLLAKHGREAESLWQGCNATIPGVEVIPGERLQFQCLAERQKKLAAAKIDNCQIV